MLIHTLPISSLHPDPANARLHPQRNLDVIRASLQRFGQQKPIVIDANNVVRAGNGTLEAARSLGWTEIRCVRTELANTEATAYAIADNRSGELATWDDAVLTATLADVDLGDVGFTAAELADLLHDDPFAGAEPPAPLPVPETYQVIVECRDEDDQKQVFEQMTGEGRPCRLLTL